MTGFSVVQFFDPTGSLADPAGFILGRRHVVANIVSANLAQLEIL
jgi:hypothetical protein